MATGGVGVEWLARLARVLPPAVIALPWALPLALCHRSVPTAVTLAAMVVVVFRIAGSTLGALVAVAVAALTLYDMVKAVDREARITDVSVVEKSGGRSGHWKRTGKTGTADGR
jgi:cyclic pyranopterin phosphate synthase